MPLPPEPPPMDLLLIPEEIFSNGSHHHGILLNPVDLPLDSFDLIEDPLEDPLFFHRPFPGKAPLQAIPSRLSTHLLSGNKLTL